MRGRCFETVSELTGTVHAMGSGIKRVFEVFGSIGSDRSMVTKRYISC